MLWFSLQWYVSPEYYHKTLASFFVEHNWFLACETTKAWQKLLQFCMSECVSAFKYLCVCLVCVMINVNHDDDQRSLLFRSVWASFTFYTIWVHRHCSNWRPKWYPLLVTMLMNNSYICSFIESMQWILRLITLDNMCWFLKVPLTFCSQVLYKDNVIEHLSIINHYMLCPMRSMLCD